MTTTASSTLLQMTESIALDFLHSVVLIDDRLFLKQLADEPEEPVPTEIVAPARRGAVRTEESADTAAGSGTTTDHPLDAKPLLDRFAEQGLVCAALRLDKEEDAKRAVKAAKRADIVVLDWKINGIYGDTTLQLIRDVVDTGDRDRLRLIAIYTGENNLVDVTARVRTELDALVGSKYLHKRDDPYGVTRGPVSIVVYAKAETKLPEEDAELFARIAPADVLPDRLLTDFARMTSGLVSNVALDALARLRANMHRLLLRLHPGLDAAYLSHRALVMPPEEAEEHLVSLVVAEIAGMLEETGVGREANLDAIRAWIQDRLAAGTDFKAVFNLGALDPVDGLCTMLTMGVDNQAIPGQFKQLRGKKHARGLTARFCTPEDAPRRDAEFAMLLSLRQRYASRPYLTLGTVLRAKTDAGNAYWLCVQPGCHALRLTVNRQFPLLPLAIVGGEQDPFDVIVIDGSDVLRMKASSKPYEQTMPEFAPDKDSGTVLPVVRDDKAKVFTAIDGREFFWIGELKPDYAQRFLHSLGSEQSSVALVESEWMRRSRES